MNELQYERKQTRAEVASLFRQLADGFRQHEKVTFVAAQERSTIHPAETIHVRMKTKEDCPWVGSDGRSIVLELGWTVADEELERPSIPAAQSNGRQQVRGSDHS